MNRRGIFYLFVAGLALAGLLIAWLRHTAMDIPLVPGETRSVWLVEARVDFVAGEGPVTVSLSLPEETPGYRIVGQQSASPGYGFAVVSDEGDRRGEWTRRRAEGLQSLYYTAYFVPSRGSPRESVLQEQTPETPRAYWEDAERLAAEALVASARETSSSPRSLTRELIKLLDHQADQNSALLLSGDAERAEVLRRLLSEAGVSSRPAMGLHLEDARRRQTLTPMIEVYTGEGWELFNPRTGAAGVPDDLLLWHRGGRSLLDVSGGTDSRVSFSMIKQTVPALQLSGIGAEQSVFSLLSISALPIEEQSMFKLLLLLPIGALVVVFARVMVGLKTAGTFMPVLISLVFLQTSLVPGLTSFVVVVGLGLLLRGYLSRLNLLLVARIATLIVLVIFMITALSVLGYQLGYNTGMIITFFPMIIIAWTIERMSILWEEEGPRDVLVQGGGSLLVAVIAFSLMQLPLVKHLSFNFPELHLVILAGILAMGQYTGYRLLELRRFHAMARDLEH